MISSIGAQDDERALLELESYVKEHVSEHAHHPHVHTLWTWGSNQYGQLPLAEVTDQSSSAISSNFDSTGTNASRVAQIHCGGVHTGIVLKGGKLLLFGSGADPDPEPDAAASALPRSMRYLSPKLTVSTLALGHAHALLLTISKRLFGFGDDTHGQVTSCGVSGAVQIDGWRELRLASEHQLVVVAIAAGVTHSAAVTGDGELYTWGAGKHGQCLATDQLPWKPSSRDAAVVGVQCGQKHTIFRDTEQRVWSIGSNNWGQLGRDIVGDSKARGDAVPAIVELPGPIAGRKIVSVACGWSHSAVMCSSGACVCLCLLHANCGSNMRPKTLTCCVFYSDEGTYLVGWGRVDLGQLPGFESDTRSVSYPVLIPVSRLNTTIVHSTATLILDVLLWLLLPIAARSCWAIEQCGVWVGVHHGTHRARYNPVHWCSRCVDCV